MAGERSPGSRAFATLQVLVLFHVVVFLVAGALIVGAILLIDAALALLGAIHQLLPPLALFLLAALLLVVAGVIVWAAAPRFDRLSPPGPELRPGRAPALGAELHEIVARTGQKAPDHVFLVPGVELGTDEVGGFMGMRSRRVMVLGLAVLEVLTVSELRAALALALARGRDNAVRLRRWLSMTRASIARLHATLRVAAEGPDPVSRSWTNPFGLVERILSPVNDFLEKEMRVVTRELEQSADDFACRVAGSAAFIEMSWKLHVAPHLYGSYFRATVAPVLEAGFLPPITAGFGTYFHGDRVQTILAEAIDEVLDADEQHDPDGSPALRARVAMAERLDQTVPSEDARPAIALVRDVHALERDIFCPFPAEPLPSIEWAEVAERVYVPCWKARAGDLARVLRHATPATLPREPPELGGLYRARYDSDLAHYDRRDVRQLAAIVHGTALALLLLDRGFVAESVLDGSVVLRRAERAFAPFDRARAYVACEISAEEWRAELEELGVATVELGAIFEPSVEPAGAVEP